MSVLENICSFHIRSQIKLCFGGEIFALYFRPHCLAIDSISAPTPRNLSSGGGWRWVQLELTDASMSGGGTETRVL